jgi:hypothetical protein
MMNPGLPMAYENVGPKTTFGYLSAVESAEHGFFGGYLLISPTGRPIEFHCTAPVRPNRAQQILYGPTLRPYLLGEQIGGALVREATITPSLILTDQKAVLGLRSQLNVPLVHVEYRSQRGQEANPGAADASTGANGGWPAPAQQFCIVCLNCCIASGYEEERETVIELLEELHARVDVLEPFERIYQAIQEAQRIGCDRPEKHGQAA